MHKCSKQNESYVVQLLLMKRGGQVIYAGPLGQNSQKLIEYFEVIKVFELVISCFWKALMYCSSIQYRQFQGFLELKISTTQPHGC